jgi:hypothetical protein
VRCAASADVTLISAGGIATANTNAGEIPDDDIK